MSNLPKIFGGIGLPTQGIPQLPSTDFLSRAIHSWKLEDLARIAELECKIAKHNLSKMQYTMQAMTDFATFGERVKASLETVELSQRNFRAQVKQEEAKAKIIDTEARKEEFDFIHYMERVQDED